MTDFCIEHRQLGFWIVCIIAGVGLLGAVAAIGMFVVGLVLTWFSEAKERQRGFEVKLTTGETPVLQKEDNHG